MSIVNPLFYFLHVVAVVLWIGGIGYTLFVLMPAVPRISLRDRANFIPMILNRFLVVVWAAAAVLAVTGLHRMFGVWHVAQEGFFSTSTGHTLAFKLVMVGVLIGIALLVTFRTVPKARAHVSTHRDDPSDAYQCGQCRDIVGGMRHVLWGALVVALVVIYAAIKLRGV